MISCKWLEKGSIVVSHYIDELAIDELEIANEVHEFIHHIDHSCHIRLIRILLRVVPKQIRR